MNKSTGKVLVLGSDNRSFLTVIRSLGRSGKEVHVAWCARDSVAVCSKYVAKIHSLTRPPSECWKTEFGKLLDQECFDLVIPCNDPSIWPLHQHRDVFQEHKIYLVNREIFDTVMDKGSVNAIARRAGIRLPREVVIRSPDEMDEINAITSPYVLKPTQSYVANKLSAKNHVVIESSERVARHRISEMLKVSPVAIQDFFVGAGVGVEFLAKHGEILVAFQHERLHEPPSGGGSSYRKSCKLDPELSEATAALVKELNYTGIGMAEYCVNRSTRDWIFVELNARFWGSLPLAIASGVDFPNHLYDLLCRQRVDFPTDYSINRTCRNWLLDVKWLRQTAVANGFSLFRHASCCLQLAAELRYPLTLREFSDTFQWDDAAPAKQELVDSVGAIPRRFRRKVRNKMADYPAFRRRARRRLLRHLESSSEILFVCKGNICRSPFAAQYVSQKVSRFRGIHSTGYFPKTNRESPVNAQVAANEFDVDLSNHRSTVISQEAIDRADVILVFDAENEDEVLAKFPEAKRKTFMLGTLLVSPDSVISDPYGGTVDDFRLIYTQISQALESFAFGNEQYQHGT